MRRTRYLSHRLDCLIRRSQPQVSSTSVAIQLTLFLSAMVFAFVEASSKLKLSSSSIAFGLY